MNSRPTDTDDDLDDIPASLGTSRKAPPRGTKAFMMVGILTGISLLVFFTWSGFTNQRTAPVQPKITISEPPPLARSEPPAIVIPAPEAAAASPLIDASTWSMPSIDVPQVDMVRQRRLNSSLTGQQSQEPTPQPETPKPAQPFSPSGTGPLANQLQGLTLQAAVAGQLPDRNLLMTQGTMIDCVLQSRLVSTQAGMVSCQATRDIRSSNGKVVLIDAGSKFIGYQQGGINQGQARVFVVWSRMISPSGVTINLDSPGTGPLGEAGLDGAVDHHFGQRFGNAILVSLIDDLGTWASNQGSNSNGIRFDSTQDGATNAITTILENSVNIPPTLYKNQGERVGIFVARDLDFRSVYDLRPAQR